jgi:hypothetical protein
MNGLLSQRASFSGKEDEASILINQPGFYAEHGIKAL